jgi:nanoRNase/pAp phosphatase (c-di-AMP/oligoRNAs hydrolase)
LYDNPRHRETFKIVSDLIDEGVSIELLENRSRRYAKDEIAVLGELANNLQSVDGYSYSFVGDSFTRQWLQNDKSADEFKLGCELFVSGFIRNIGENKWGFIVYPDLTAGEKRYSASFRALGSVKDVAEIARRLGGGGHKPAAGAKFSAASIRQAVEKVRAAI